MSSKLNSFNFSIENTNFESFVKKISELTKLGEMVKIKFDADGQMLMYSVSAKSIQAPIHAFKGYLSDIDSVIKAKSSVPDTGLNFILLTPKNFVKSVKLFGDETVTGVIKYRPDKKDAHEMVMSSGKLKLNFVGGDPTLIRDLTRQQIEVLSDADNADFSFSIGKDDLLTIKKLSAASVGNDIVNFYVRDNVLSVGDSKWNLEIGACNQPDTKLTMNKKYFSSIENLDTIDVNVYERFIVITTNETLLMISLELDEL